MKEDDNYGLEKMTVMARQKKLAKQKYLLAYSDLAKIF